MTTSGITNINAKLIHQHPDNPRKDLGDLTELSESIKKKGIMQNLTVIPGNLAKFTASNNDGGQYYYIFCQHNYFYVSDCFECRCIIVAETCKWHHK